MYPLISAGSLTPKAGEPANFMLVNAVIAKHAIASAPVREAVFSGGKLVGGKWTAAAGSDRMFDIRV